MFENILPPEAHSDVDGACLGTSELPEGFFIALSGKTDQDRSILALSWAMKAARRGSRVLYLDKNNPLGIAQSRIKKFGGTPNNMTYWGSWSSNPVLYYGSYDGVQVLTKFAKEHKPLLIVDSLEGFSFAKTNQEYENELQRLKILSRFGITVLILCEPPTNFGRTGLLIGHCDLVMSAECVERSGVFERASVSKPFTNTVRLNITSSRIPMSTQHYEMSSGIPIKLAGQDEV